MKNKYLLVGAYHPLEMVIPDKWFYLSEIEKIYEFDENNRPTNKVAAYRLTVNRNVTFKQFLIKLPANGIKFSVDDFQERQEAGKHIAVIFENARIAVFYDSKTKNIFESIKADSATIREIQ